MSTGRGTRPRPGSPGQAGLATGTRAVPAPPSTARRAMLTAGGAQGSLSAPPWPADADLLAVHTQRREPAADPGGALVLLARWSATTTWLNRASHPAPRPCKTRER